ncbi:MAG: hypothetical protein SCH71_06880 [Desulfobulbaceae bacterium]|nr:hypothetical protein [Desulfobulbaceae bacterium]
MKNKLSLLFAFLFVAAMPLGLMAMSHEDMDHQGHQSMNPKMEEHGANDQPMHEMAGHEEMAMLGFKVEDGVKASAHLNDIGEAMAKMGMKETHHFMIFFEDADSGDLIPTGSAALKIKNPDGTESGPVSLIGMEGHFGADIVLPEKGEYELTVGSKLPDGKTRQFEFKHQLN